MKSFSYNDMDFTISKVGDGWEILTGKALVAAGLYSGLSESEAIARSVALVRTIFPVGVKVIGPDVAHPITVGDIKYFPPDVAHPNFVYWNQDSASQPQQL